MSMAEENPTFTTVRMREGYDIGEVDAYLDRLAEELRGRQDPDGPEDVTPRQPSAPVPWAALAVIALVVVVLLVVVR